MFDKFLKVAHQAPTASHRVSAEQDLFDFLSSEPKVACFTGHDDHKWLEQFAGTPMQEQAMALEQQDIQNEIAEKQYNMQNSGKQQSFWQNRDQIQLQKRMLELQLYQAKTGPSVAAAASGAPAPTGPEADAATVGAGGGSPATPETGMMETGAKVAFTLSDAARQAGEEELAKSAAVKKFLWADQMGRMMAKQALDMTALKGLGNTALDWAKKNPTKALSAAGGVGGAAYGAATAKGQNGQGPTIGQRLGRAAGFGALGAGAGAAAGAGMHGVQAVRGRMAATGETARQATGGLLAEKATGAYDKLHSAAVNADAQQRAAVAANPNAATSMVEGLSPHLENFRNRVGSWAHGV